MFRNVRTKLAAGVQRLVGFRTARRMVRQEDGAAAVEFALVAAPFLAMVFAIIETAMVFFAGQALETAATDSARLIMTVQAQNGGYEQAKFMQAFCGKISGQVCASSSTIKPWDSINAGH